MCLKKLSGRFIVWCSLRFCRMQHKGQPLLPWPFQSILVHVSPGYGFIYLDLHFLSDETCASICSHCKKKSKSIIFFSYKTADYQCKLKAWLMMINLSFSKRFGDLIFNPSLVKKKKSNQTMFSYFIPQKSVTFIISEQNSNSNGCQTCCYDVANHL